MNRVLRFLFGGVPPRKTHQGGVQYRRDERAVGGVRVYIDEAHRMEAWQIRDAIRRQLPGGWVPCDDPVEASITFVYPQRKTDNLPPEVFVPHTEKPDADNLVKTILDQATAAGVWTDDARVFDLRVRKFRAAVPRWSIEVAFGGYGFVDHARMALDELKAAVRALRRRAKGNGERKGERQGEMEFGQ